MSNLGNRETMSKNLKFYIDKSGKSQKEIADIIGVSTSTFNEWVKGKNYPRIDKIEKLANYFGILKSDLIEEKSEDHKEMQKNNGIIVNAVNRMRQDPEFLSVVNTLGELDAEQFNAVKSLLSAFSKADK